MSVIAGTKAPGYFGDSGLAVYAQLNNPLGIHVNRTTGKILVADPANFCIRQIDMKNNTVNTVYSGMHPTSVAMNSYGEVFISDEQNRINKILTNRTFLALTVHSSFVKFSGAVSNAVGGTTSVSGNVELVHFGDWRLAIFANLKWVHSSLMLTLTPSL